jgi:hypothetical protein
MITHHVMKNTMGDYSIPAISESYNGCLPYFSGEEGTRKEIERFMP